jgi:hypothetical protein
MISAILVILAVAIGVPLILFIVLEALARYGLWAQGHPSGRRAAFSIVSALYVVLAIGMFSSGSQHFAKWFFLIAAIAMAFCAWWEGRTSGTKVTRGNHGDQST